ncbi:glycosyltransferase [Vibrio rotiferianus]|uniref:glycosyltransferase n=1 Tax=Vibrio rotiferianus TaxID=190895 RepID=UPI00406A1192
MEKVTFLVAAYGERLLNVPDIFLRQREEVSYVVVSQCTSKSIQDEFLKKISHRSDVVSVFSDETGVTKSRNLAIKHIPSDASYVFFLDDDVELEKLSYEKLIQSFAKSDYDVLTFSVSDLAGNRLIKNYADKEFKHNNISILKVGTIEIAVRASVLLENSHITFPENLGAGAKYPLCDEPVFLSRLIKSGCKLGFIPEVITRHPLESSGKEIKNSNEMMARGIAFREIFGSLSLVLNFAFFLKSFKKIRYSKLLALRDIYKGYFLS